MFDQLLLKCELYILPCCTGLRKAVNSINYKIVAIDIIQHSHVKGGSDRTLFFIASHMQITVSAAIGQAMNKPRVAMESENDVLIFCKYFVVTLIAKTMRTFAFWL